MSLIKSFFGGQAKANSSETGAIEMSDVGHPIIIVDVGCRWGFAERFLGIEDKDKFKIFGFDPDEEECKKLQLEYQHLPEGFVNCIPVALAGFGGRRNLFLTKEPACSSLHLPMKFLADHYPALDCINLDRVVAVDVVSLSEWALKNGLKSVDYIKIDTQGSELEILCGAEDLIATTRCIDIEVEFNPIYEGQSLFGETDTYLRSKGFVLWRLSNLVHYSIDGELLPLNEVNSVCFDTNIRQETDAYGGQLFWADARYVHSDVLKKISLDSRRDRDVLLFKALGMRDVVHHIEKMRLL